MEKTFLATLVVQLSIVLAGCQTTIVPPAGSEIRQNGNLTEIIPRVDPPTPEPICLVRARFFRGLVGVPCAQLAQEVRP